MRTTRKPFSDVAVREALDAALRNLLTFCLVRRRAACHTR